MRIPREDNRGNCPFGEKNLNCIYELQKYSARGVRTIRRVPIHAAENFRMARRVAGQNRDGYARDVVKKSNQVGPEIG